MASHVGGAPVSIALSMGLDNKSDKNSRFNSIPCLILGSTSSIRTFSIILKQKSENHLAINLTNLSKISLSFEPSTILPLSGIFGGSNVVSPPLSNKLANYHIDIPDILITSNGGALSVIPYAPKGGKKASLLIQSPVLKHPSYMKATADGSVLCLLSKGEISFSNSINGNKLPSKITGSHVSCIATSNDVIAIGFNCGIVELYNSKTMKLLRTIPNINSLPPHKGNYKTVSSSIQSLESLKEKDLVNNNIKVDCNISLSCLLFICNGEILVIAYSNGIVSLSNTTGYTIQISNSTSVSKSNSSPNISLVDCVGDVNMFGIIRKENEIELITVSSYSSLSFNIIDTFKMLHDTNILKSTIIHLSRKNHIITINIIANVIGNSISTSSILSSTINLSNYDENNNKKIKKSINFIPRINLGTSFNTNSVCFYDNTCAITLYSGIYMIDLDELESVCITNELVTFDAVTKICKHVVSLDNSPIGMYYFFIYYYFINYFIYYFFR
jgi:hypothetical protein